MKKLLTLVITLLVVSCMKDDLQYITPYTVVPESLVISEQSGIKLTNYLVSDEVSINVKLPTEGTYRIKIRDISNKVVSQEKLHGDQGDNILKIYVRTLPISSYTVELLTDNNKIIGRQVFGILN